MISGPVDATIIPIRVTPPVAAETGASVPTLALHAVYPNPLSLEATVTFALPEAQAIRLTIYDMLGREVAVLAEGTYPADTHVVRFDTRTLAAGVYFVRLQAEGAVQSRKVLVVR